MVIDSPVKIGLNTINDLLKKGRVKCQLSELPSYYGELKWSELARLAALHRELTAHMAELLMEQAGEEARRRKRASKKAAEERKRAAGGATETESAGT